MRITEEVIENAVLQVFMDLQVPAGGRLSANLLSQEWPKTRLRTGDLIQGIKRLVFGGILELDDDMNGTHFILSPAGHDRAMRLPSGPRGTWNQFVSGALLNFVRGYKFNSRKHAARRGDDSQISHG